MLDELVRLLLPAESRDTVSGDLLEEYREGRLPAVGPLRAQAWYLRQAAGIFLRAYGWFVVPLVLWLVVHDVANTFRDATGTPYLDGAPGVAGLALGSGVLLTVSAYGSRRTGRWGGGLVAALGTVVVVWTFMAVWWMVTLYPFAQYQQTNPYWIQAWHWSTHRPNQPVVFGWNPDTPDESFLRWIFWDNVGALFFAGLAMSTLSLVCGTIGGTIGRYATSARPKFPMM